MSLIPASKSRTPSPSRTKYTFMDFSGKPPRMTQTPSAIGSGSVAMSRARPGRIRTRPLLTALLDMPGV